MSLVILTHLWLLQSCKLAMQSLLNKTSPYINGTKSKNMSEVHQEDLKPNSK